MMFVTSPWLSGLVLVAIPLIVLPLMAYGRVVKNLSRKAQDTLAEASAYASENLSAARTMQAFGHEGAVAGRYSRRRRASVRGGAGSPEGARGPDRDHDSPGRGQRRGRAVVRRVIGDRRRDDGRPARPVRDLRAVRGRCAGRTVRSVGRADAGSGRDRAPGRVAQGGAGDPLAGTVQWRCPSRRRARSSSRMCVLPMRRGLACRRWRIFRSVWRQARRWRWSGHRAPARRRSSICCCGSMIPRPGSIRVDGVDVKDADLDALRERMSLVPQDVAIFADTVIENIRYGTPGADLEAVKKGRARGAGRGIHPRAAQRLRDAARRARRHVVGRSAPAPGHRARDPARRADPAARRGDQRARCRERAARAAGARRRDEGAHDAGHRASARNGAEGEPHPGDGQGPHRAGGHARPARRQGRPVRPAWPSCSSGAKRRSNLRAMRPVARRPSAVVPYDRALRPRHRCKCASASGSVLLRELRPKSPSRGPAPRR